MSQGSSAKVLMTPAFAQRLLDDTSKIIRNDPKTKEHRNICQQTVLLYTRVTLNGDWALNGEVISLDRAGAVLNGKHRLLACIAGGVNFTTFLAKNVDRATFDRFAIHCGVRSTPALIVAASDRVSAILSFEFQQTRVQVCRLQV